MSEEGPPTEVRPFSGRTAWARNLQTPLQVFLRTEAGSAAVLLGTAVAALAWVNISASSYDAVWGARLSVLLAGAGVSLDLVSAWRLCRAPAARSAAVAGHGRQAQTPWSRRCR